MAILKGTFAPTKRRKFFVIICGEPGCGKTTIGMSGTKPLLCDFDGGLERVSASHRNGDYISNGKWEEYRADMKLPEIDQYETIVIDTVGAMVTLIKDWAMRTKPGARTKTGEFNNLKGSGIVKNEALDFINYIYNVKGKNIVLIFHTMEKNDNDGNVLVRLFCEGGTKDAVWTQADFGGYLHWADGKRVLQFEPTSAFQAKRCYGIKKMYDVPELSQNTPNEFLANLFAEAERNIENEAQNLNRMRYDQAVARGRDIVDTITDGDSATQAIAFLRQIEHALTSKEEIGALFKRKLAELNLVYDGQRYVPKKTDEPKKEQLQGQTENSTAQVQQNPPQGKTEGNAQTSDQSGKPAVKEMNG